MTLSITTLLAICWCSTHSKAEYMSFKMILLIQWKISFLFSVPTFFSGLQLDAAHSLCACDASLDSPFAYYLQNSKRPMMNPNNTDADAATVNQARCRVHFHVSTPPFLLIWKTFSAFSLFPIGNPHWPRNLSGLFFYSAAIRNKTTLCLFYILHSCILYIITTASDYHSLDTLWSDDEN